MSKENEEYNFAANLDAQLYEECPRCKKAAYFCVCRFEVDRD